MYSRCLQNTKSKSLSCVRLFETQWNSPWNSPGQNTGVGSLSLLQGIFPTQGSNPGLQHCRQILYQLSHKGRPRKLEWVAYPFSSRSSRPRNLTRSPPPQADSLPAESPGKPTSAGGMGLIPGSGRFPGGGNGNPLQYSFQDNPRDRGAWSAKVLGIAKQLSD